MNNNTSTHIVSDAYYVVPLDGISKRLQEEELTILNVKLGFDPTAPDLHLGHAVVLRKLREFQDAGHNVIVIVGDFTAMIGDPTGRDQTRPPLTKEKITENSKTYIAQLSKILDTDRISVRYNSEWLQDINFLSLIELASKFTVAKMMSRDDFQNRTQADNPIFLHEFLYPLMQAYDSIAVKSDVELGGTDQLFNCMMGRDLQEKFGMRTQTVVTMPLLVGTDGIQKMSKSKNNYIGLTEPAEIMYGKCMSIPDICLEQYLRLAALCKNADFLLEKMKSGEIHPMDLKKIIAFEVVKTYHNKERAKFAADHFQRIVQEKRLLDSDFTQVSLAQLGVNDVINIVDVIHMLMSPQSKSSIRRLIDGGGVYLDGTRVSSIDLSIDHKNAPFKLRIGKKVSFILNN